LIKFTPTLVLPPQGGGQKKRVNYYLKGEEMKIIILPLRGKRQDRSILSSKRRQDI